MTAYGKDEWLAKRRELITASDFAAILGFDERRTALDVFAEKITGRGMDETDYLMIGHAFEPGIANLYTGKTGRPVFNPGDFSISIHQDIPWIGATLDRETWETHEDSQSIPGVPLELKHVGWYNSGAWKNGDVPLYVQIQLQAQMACVNALWGAYCGVVGGSEIHLGDLDFNLDFFESALPHLEEFRRRLQENDPPPVTSSRCLTPIKALYPNDSGDTVTLGEEYRELAEQWEQAKADKKSAEDKAKEIEAKLRAAIGEATFGALPDGTTLTLKTTERKGYTREVKPSTYRTLRRKA